MRIENKIVDGWAEAVLAELNKTRYIRFPQGLPANTAMTVVSNESEIMETILIEQINVSVYPNPSEGDVTIKFEEAKEAEGFLIDGMGRKARSLKFNEADNVFEIKNLAHGIYTLAIFYNDGSSESKRIIIK